MTQPGLEYLNAKGWLTVPEREWLIALAQDVYNGGCIINIGIEFGASLICLHIGCPSAILVGIDIEGAAKMELATSIEGLIVIKGDSNLIGRYWEQASLVFVDGSHEYADVKADAFYWGLAVQEGGRIAFHDCFNSPAEWDVNRAVGEWADENQYAYQELKVVDSIRTFERKFSY